VPLRGLRHPRLLSFRWTKQKDPRTRRS
jgi:hypothetical protein